MKFRAVLCCIALLLLSTVFCVAQSSATPSSDDKSGAAAASKTADSTASGQASEQSADPLKRPITEKQKKANSKALKQELSSTYKKWLNEDVRYIITPEEESAFKQLSNDEERDQFIEQFWLRRDPTPDTPENEFKEEHYRRIAYANEHFAAGIPGLADRSRPHLHHLGSARPDRNASHRRHLRSPLEEGGGETTTYPFEDWRYRYLEGVGQEVELEFVDTCLCGDYHLTTDVNEKDALLHTPGGGRPCTNRWAWETGPSAWIRLPRMPARRRGWQNTKEFDKLEMLAKVQTASQDQVQGPGRGRQPQDQRQPDALRGAHRFREGYRRHRAGSR